MLDLGQYLLAFAAVALLVAALAVIAVRLRGAILPAWGGSRARLAEAVVGVGALTTLALVLGSFGILRTATLLPLSVIVAGAVNWKLRGRGGKPRGRGVRQSGGDAAADGDADPTGAGAPQEFASQPHWSRFAAVAVATVVLAHWGIAVSWSLDAGITNFDSVWYHLPFAAEIAQSGSTLELIRTDTVFVNWLYPQGSELLHAVGMLLTGRDLLSLVLNLGWLALAFLAAWCIGRPFGRGHLTVAAAAVLLECHNLVARTPGTAKNDIMAVALLLSAVALLINLASSQKAARESAGGRAAGSGPEAQPPPSASPLQPGWPLALAALAVGLAVGTKVTALAPAAGLTISAIALVRPGLRLRASCLWLAGVAVGGAYWYLRNLIVAANPLPQMRHLGPLGLPGPDRLQTGRPDFTVSHYLLDTTVWREYFFPGLERGFGPLWPLVLAAAIAGALLAAWRLLRHLAQHQAPQPPESGSDGTENPALTGWFGVAALLAMVAYLFTPLSAAGAEGSPTAFAINLRFAIPALMLGLVLLPLTPRLGKGRLGWVTFSALVLLALVTNRADALLTGSGRLFGWALAIVLIVVPALALARSRRPHHPLPPNRSLRSLEPPRNLSRQPHRPLILAALAYLLALVAIGYPLQRNYFEHRYADFQPELGLSDVYRWASERSDTRIGLAGTTAGFHGFGFYGADLSNDVVYLGRPAKRGGFNAIANCDDFRRAVNAADLDYLVTSPFLNFANIEAPVPSPEARWIGRDPAVEAEIEKGPVTLWRVDGALGAGCGSAEEPLTEIPDSPGR